MMHTSQPTNPRASRSRAQRRLLWIVIAFLVIGGTPAIVPVYGLPAYTEGFCGEGGE